MLVLYVDDEPSMLRLVSIWFEEDTEISIVGTTSASKALELLRTNHFDVMVSDYQIPGMDGIALVKDMRGRGDMTPFILFTGQGRE